jgi:hypothetical protein
MLTLVRSIRVKIVLVLIGLVILCVSALSSTATNGTTKINTTKTGQNLDGFKFNLSVTNQTINDNSLVLALNLDNNTRIGETSTKAVDESRYHNNGTISGATWTSAGRINSALQFDGIDDHVDCGNSSTLDLTDEITIELWMKPEAAQEVCWDGVKGNYGVIAKAVAGIPRDYSRWWSWQLRYGSPDNCRLGFQFNINPLEESKWVTVKQKLMPGLWYYIAGTFDGTTIKCYLNGALKDTNQISRIALFRIQPTDARLLIGEDGWHNMFNGTIDEVRIYRRALTAQEIMLHYKQDKNSSVRIGAARALGNINDTRAVEPLILALKDNNSGVRIGAAWALGNINDTRAVEPLILALKDNNSSVRSIAAMALGNINDKRAVEPLILALKDNDCDVRSVAAIALGNINDTRAVEPLILALKDNNSGVRSAAKDALAKLGWHQGST